MARLTTPEVVFYLHGSPADALATTRQGNTPGKARNPVGRPPSKPNRLTDGKSTAASGANHAAGSMMVGEGPKETSTVRKWGQLGNPKAVGRPRKQVKTMARGADIYTTPESPQAAAPARNRGASGNGSRYSLNNSAFDAVSPNDGVDGEIAQSPLRVTRSRTKRANPHEEKRIETSGPVVHTRNLRSRAPPPDPMEDASLDVKDEAEQRPVDLKFRKLRRLRSSPPPREAASMNSSDSAYVRQRAPSRTSRVTRRNGASGSATIPASDGRAVKKSRKSVGGHADYQTLDGGGQGRDEDYVNKKKSEMMVEDEEDEDEDEGEEAATLEASEGTEEEEDGDEEEGAEEENTAKKESNIDDGEGEVEGQGEEANRAGKEGTSAEDDESQPHSQERPGKSRFEIAAEFYDCWQEWKDARNAARKNQKWSDPQSRPIRELMKVIHDFIAALRATPTKLPQPEDDSLFELEEKPLEKISRLLGNLRKTDERPEEQLRIEIYGHAIPRAVKLLCSILVARFANGTLSEVALEELSMILRAVRGLCERISQWKPTINLGDGIKSRTNSKIKSSLKTIEDQYQKALSDLREEERVAEARLREKRFEEKRARLEDAERHARAESQRNFTQWTQRFEIPTRNGRQQRVPDRLDERSVTRQPEAETYDVDDLDLDETPHGPVDGFEREATEEIPGPTKRIWRKEETIALLSLLQKYRGPDRYERIQEVISEVARQIRKVGADRLLSTSNDECSDVGLDGGEGGGGGGVDDVLDDLGEMEVGDIEQQTRYLKEAHAVQMERYRRVTGDGERWRWLYSA